MRWEEMGVRGPGFDRRRRMAGGASRARIGRRPTAALPVVLLAVVAGWMASPVLAGLVAEVKASNFDSLVRDSPTDTLLVVYDPECGQCIRAMPVVEAVAISLRGVPTISVGAINAVEQHVPGDIPFEELPVVFFFPGSGGGGRAGDGGSRSSRYKGRVASSSAPSRSKGPVEYSGPVTVDGLFKFLRDNARSPEGIPEPVAENAAQGEPERQWTKPAGSGFDPASLFAAMHNELNIMQEQMQRLTHENAALKERLRVVSENCQSSLQIARPAQHESAAPASRAGGDPADAAVNEPSGSIDAAYSGSDAPTDVSANGDQHGNGGVGDGNSLAAEEISTRSDSEHGQQDVGGSVGTPEKESEQSPVTNDGNGNEDSGERPARHAAAGTWWPA